MERVLVVPTDLFLEILRPPRDRFHPGSAHALLGIVAEKGFFADRPRAEEDPTLKQVIPYAVVLCGGDVFLLRRTRKGGEARLHEKVSLGVGGHVNPEDAAEGDLGGAVERAFERELHEELRVESAFRREVVGVLNDDSNPVGQVHCGIVYRVELEEPRVAVREEESLSGGFVPVAEVARHGERMETWSRMLQEHFWPARREA